MRLSVKVLVLQLFSPSNRLLSVSVLMCIFNTAILFFGTWKIDDACFQVWQKQFKTSVFSKPHNHLHKEHAIPQYDFDDTSEVDHWDILQEGEAFKITLTGSFDWDIEFTRMLSIIPVLEYWTNKTDEKGRERMDMDEQLSLGNLENFTYWEKSLSLSRVMRPVRFEIGLPKIYDVLVDLNKKGPLETDNVDLHPNHPVWNCQEIENLENSQTYPKIRYTFRSITFWKGLLYLSAKETIQITQRRFIKLDSDKKDSEQFSIAKKETLNILLAQGWYGIPKLHALCITDKHSKDITENVKERKEMDESAHFIRYTVARYDERNSIPFCLSDTFSEECLRLNQLSTFIRAKKHPAVAAIKVMLNTARVFENLWINRAYIDEMKGNEILMTRDFNIYLTGLYSLKFLSSDGYSLDSNHSRILSGTVCQRSKECPVPSWHTSQIGFKVGQSCAEVRGFCTNQNTCWGIDTHMYACIFSRWLYGRLRPAVPQDWQYEHVLAKLIRCGTEPLPDVRCTWTNLRKGLENLLKSAIETWPDEEEA